MVRILLKNSSTVRLAQSACRWYSVERWKGKQEILPFGADGCRESQKERDSKHLEDGDVLNCERDKLMVCFRVQGPSTAASLPSLCAGGS